MPDLKIYEYAGCGSCRKARQYLAAHQVTAKWIPVREQPPTKAELKRMLAIYDGNVKKLFNTSGRDYREAGLGAKLPSLTAAEALELLADNGNLVKRPFVLTKNSGAVGFNEGDWKRLLETA